MRYLRYSAVVLLIFLCLMIFRVSISQYGYFVSAQRAYEQGEYFTAADEYGKALRFYIPLSPLNSASYQKLMEIADIYIQRGDLYISLYSLETARSALYGSRSFYLPMKDEAAAANERIAELKAKILIMDNYPNSFDTAKAELKYIMSNELAPHPMWSAVAVLSFILFCGLVLVRIFTGRPKFAPYYSAGLFALWLLALFSA